MAATRGFALAAVRIIDQDGMTDDQFHKCYSEELVPLIIRHPSHLTPRSALRYKSISATSDRPYFTFYLTSNVFVLRSQLISRISGTARTAPSAALGGKSPQDVIDFETRPFRLLRIHANPQLDGEEDPDAPCLADMPDTIVVDVMHNAPGGEHRTIAKDDFVGDYRPPECITKHESWHKTSAYKRMDGKSPRYMVIHEFHVPVAALPDSIAQCEHEDHQREVFELLEVQGELVDE